MKPLSAYYTWKNLLRSFLASLVILTLIFAFSSMQVLWIYALALVFFTLAGPAIAAKEDLVAQEEENQE